MNGSINPGDRCIVTRDVMVGERAAFTTGEQVVVERVEPDALQPQYRYVVHSDLMQQNFVLSDADLRSAVIAPPPPGQQFLSSKPKSNRKLMTVAVIVMLVVGAGVLAAAVLVKTNKSGSKPSSSPSTSAALPSGWITYKANGLEISLPPAYEGGNSKEALDAVMQKLQSMGPEYDQMVQLIKSNPEAITLFAIDADSSSPGFGSSVNIVAQPLSGSMNVGDFIDAEASMLPSAFTVSQKDVVTVNGKEMGKLVIDASAGGVDMKEIQYVVFSNGKAFAVTYAAPAKVFSTLEPDFEKSIANAKFP